MARLHIIECEHRSAFELFGKKAGAGTEVKAGLGAGDIQIWQIPKMDKEKSHVDGTSFLSMKSSFEEFYPSNGDCEMPSLSLSFSLSFSLFLSISLSLSFSHSFFLFLF